MATPAQESPSPVKSLDYREFDDLVGPLHRAPEGGPALGGFLAGFGRLLETAVVGFCVYDAGDRLISHGVSTPFKPISSRYLAGWQKDPAIQGFNRRRFARPLRLSETAPAGQLSRQAWYRAQFTDVGLGHCAMQDLEVGRFRARLIAMRAAEAPDFDRAECDFFERVGFHVSAGLKAFRPDSIRGLAGGADMVEFDFGGDPRDVSAAELDLARLGLSEAEIRVALALEDGCSVKTAADRLGLSVNTVKTHLKRIYDKLALRGLPELVHLMARRAVST
jgi:DNA-binding CsgD family transcriptional regulator